jgi:hypothetical protein
MLQELIALEKDVSLLEKAEDNESDILKRYYLTYTFH